MSPEPHNAPAPDWEPKVSPDETEVGNEASPTQDAILQEIAGLIGKPLYEIGPREILNALKDVGTWLLDAGKKLIEGLIKGAIDAPRDGLGRNPRSRVEDQNVLETFERMRRGESR